MLALLRTQLAIQMARSYGLLKVVGRDGGEGQAVGVILWRRAALVQGDITSGRKVRGAGQIDTIEPPTSSHPSQQDPIRLGFLIGRPAGDVYCNP